MEYCHYKSYLANGLISNTNYNYKIILLFSPPRHKVSENMLDIPYTEREVNTANRYL